MNIATQLYEALTAMVACYHAGGGFAIRVPEDDEVLAKAREAWNAYDARASAERVSVPYTLPAELHPATRDLVERFAAAMGEKLYAAQLKYGYSDGWADPGWMDECRAKLVEHVAKGDPRDVAAYSAFLWHHGESTAASGTAKECLTVGETDRAALVRHAIKLMQQSPPWDGKTFNPELHHTLQLLASVPATTEEPSDAWLDVTKRLYVEAQAAEAFIGVMFNANVPATINTPLGVPVKVGLIYKGLHEAIEAYEKAPPATHPDARDAGETLQDEYDARRYRWLRANRTPLRAETWKLGKSAPYVVHMFNDSGYPTTLALTNEKLDDAIDRAMGAKDGA